MFQKCGASAGLQRWKPNCSHARKLSVRILADPDCGCDRRAARRPQSALRSEGIADRGSADGRKIVLRAGRHRLRSKVFKLMGSTAGWMSAQHKSLRQRRASIFVGNA